MLVLPQSLGKDLQGLHHEKAELQREIEQRGSELAASRVEVQGAREEMEAAREEMEAARASLLVKSSEAAQAQGLSSGGRRWHDWRAGAR